MSSLEEKLSNLEKDLFQLKSSFDKIQNILTNVTNVKDNISNNNTNYILEECKKLIDHTQKNNYFDSSSKMQTHDLKKFIQPETENVFENNFKGSNKNNEKSNSFIFTF